MPQYLIAGCTGLVGQALTEQLSQTGHPITLLARRPINSTASNHQVIISDFQSFDLPAATSAIDTAFCALGTTIKKAGSQAAFAAVDLNMVINFAKAAKNSGYERFVVISSLGVNANTKNFYLSTKAKMEAALSQLGFAHLVIIRPSLLLGERAEFRLGERVAEYASKLLNPLLLGKLRRYRPVQAHAVASAMIKFCATEDAICIVESEHI